MQPHTDTQDLAESPLTVSAVEPVPVSEERIGSLDLIRGIAMLGILPVNMAFYMAPTVGMAPLPQIHHGADQVAAAATLFIFNGKMILQLAILFGAGLAIQGMRADALERPFAWYYVRRMTWLLLIGLNHALLLWYGDILVSYAILGLAALPLRRVGTRALLWCVAGFLTWYYLLMAIVSLLALLIDPAQANQAAGQDAPGITQYMTVEAQNRIYLKGPFSEMVVQRAVSVFGYIFVFLPWLAWGLLACFLLGMVFQRWGMFEATEENRPRLRRFVYLGLGIGLPLHLLAVFLHWQNPLSMLAGLLSAAGALPQALAYLSLIILWHRSRRLPRVQARFQAVGRMALTNYLMQSVLCGFIFYGYGLGQYGKLGAAAGFGIAVVIWALELAWSPVWLRYFAMGPIEWLWRSLADGRLRPFLRATAG